MQLLIAAKLGRLLWSNELECSLKLAPKKKSPSPDKQGPPSKPEHTAHFTGKYPTGFQPNPAAPAEAEAPSEPEDPEEAGAPTTAGAEDGSTDADTGDTE